MKTVDKSEVRTIDPRVYNEITEEAAIVMLEIARDLRSGAIQPESFDMRVFHWGTAHCICGWMEVRMHSHKSTFIKKLEIEAPSRLLRLFAFAGSNPSDPQLGADAIERYLFEYAKLPWG